VYYLNASQRPQKCVGGALCSNFLTIIFSKYGSKHGFLSYELLALSELYQLGVGPNRIRPYLSSQPSRLRAPELVPSGWLVGWLVGMTRFNKG
jgi:hypothetical protein